MEANKPNNAAKNIDKEAMERLVKFFSIFIEIDQRIKKEEIQENDRHN